MLSCRSQDIPDIVVTPVVDKNTVGDVTEIMIYPPAPVVAVVAVIAPEAPDAASPVIILASDWSRDVT